MNRNSVSPRAHASRPLPRRNRQLLVEHLENRVLLSSAYHLSFDDEFNSMPQIASRVGSATPGYLPTDYWNNHYLSNNAEQQYYVFPGVDSGYNPFSVSGGVLSITANRTPSGMNAGGQPYVSGELTTSAGAPYSSDIQSTTGFGQQYGYFEIRCKLPSGQGLWPAFWMMPTDGSASAEYDIFEVINTQTSDIYQTSHWNNYAGNQGYDYQNRINSADGFHVYGFLWNASTITWYVDGVATQTQPNVSNSPMYMLMNLAVGGNWPGNPDGTTPFPSSMQIDYLRAYSSDPNIPTVTPQSGYSASSTVNNLNLQVTGLSASAVSSSQINLSWSAVSGATSYSIYRSTTSGQETLLASGITATTYSDTGLSASTTYYYTVAAANSGGTGNPAAEASATTSAASGTSAIAFDDTFQNGSFASYNSGTGAVESVVADPTGSGHGNVIKFAPPGAYDRDGVNLRGAAGSITPSKGTLALDFYIPSGSVPSVYTISVGMGGELGWQGYNFDGSNNTAYLTVDGVTGATALSSAFAQTNRWHHVIINLAGRFASDLASHNNQLSLNNVGLVASSASGTFYMDNVLVTAPKPAPISAFDDSFQNGSYASYNSGTGAVESVVADPTGSGHGNVIKFAPPGAYDRDGVNLRGAAGLLTSSQGLLAFDFYIPSGSVAPVYTISVGMGGELGWQGYNFDGSNNTFYLTVDGVSGPNALSTALSQTNQWHHVVINLAGRFASDLASHNGQLSLNNVGLVCSSASGTFYMDNVQLIAP